MESDYSPKHKVDRFTKDNKDLLSYYHRVLLLIPLLLAHFMHYDLTSD